MILNIAKKEFTDQITSKRFIAILLVISLITGFSMYNGTMNFKNKYQAYYSGQIAKKPSILSIFNVVSTMGISSFGGFLGLFMGFDLITRERERNSLRTLLSHPVYRDTIINGKALGAFAALSMGVVFILIISIGAVIFNGILPTVGEIIGIIKFGIISLAYIFTFFSIALFTSTISRDSSSSLILAFGAFITLTTIIPLIGLFASDALAGDIPISIENIDDDELVKYRTEFEDHWRKRLAIMDFFSIFSPNANYDRLISSISGSNREIYEEDVTKNLIGFISTPVIFLVSSYIRFLRMEI